MSKFEIGAMVMAIEENGAYARSTGLAPIGDSRKYGHSGVIVDGPSHYNYEGEPMDYWHVRWSDEKKTWSGQRFLLLIEPPAKMEDVGQSATRETVNH